jgi:divalent metal cation (Fe/Co/Zn/Cd) transporter
MNTSSLWLRRGLQLEYLTLGWNVVGSVVVLVAAIAAHSVALAGFGLDSLIEIFASVVVVWHLTGGASKQSERKAMRLIGAGFLALSIYVLVQSLYSLITQVEPHRSWVGIAWLAATFGVMLLLAWGKLSIGRRIDNAVLLTESRVTFIDAYLAGAILVGLVLNAAFGWWWADPLAALVIVYYGFREGRTALLESREQA